MGSGTPGYSHLESSEWFSKCYFLASLYKLSSLPCSSTANKHFLRSMAHVGAGCVEFFDPKTKSKWERKVKAQLDKAFQPALTSVQVQWKQFDDDAPKPIQVGTSPPFLPHRRLSACSHLSCSIFVHTLLLFSLPLPLFLDMLSSTPSAPPPPPAPPPPTHTHTQAPQELMSLFSGSRQVVYGFVPHCKQAALQARIGGKEVETMVSTTDLGMTKGKVSRVTGVCGVTGNKPLVLNVLFVSDSAPVDG